jgi:hypothetical protein
MTPDRQVEGRHRRAPQAATAAARTVAERFAHVCASLPAGHGQDQRTSGPAFTRIGGRPGSGGRSRRTAHPACSSTRAAASVATSTRTSPGTCRQRMTITGTSWQGSNCWSGARLEPAHRLLHPNLRVTDLRFPPACWLVPPADEPASDLTLSTTHRQRVNVAVAGALVLVDSPAGHFHVALAQPDLDGSWLATQKICHALSVA